MGYTLTLYVEQYNYNFRYWRGISKCEITSYESETPLAAGDSFHEEIVLVHIPPTTPQLDYFKELIFLVFTLIFVYIILYFCRRNRCVYCQGKLVWSCRLCIRCVIVGAKPPDGVFLNALEDKGYKLQGDIPQCLPCSKFMKGLRNMLTLTFCICGDNKIFVENTEAAEINRYKIRDESLSATVDEAYENDVVSFDSSTKGVNDTYIYHPSIIYAVVRHPDHKIDPIIKELACSK